MSTTKYHNKYHNTLYCSTILKELKSNSSLTILAKCVSRDKSNVRKTLNILILNGLVDKRDHLYFLTSMGINTLNSTCGTSPYTHWTSTIPIREKIRLHKLSFTCKFWKVPKGWDRSRRLVFGLSLPPDDYLFNPYSPEVRDVRVNPLFKGGGFSCFRWGDYRVIAYASSIRIFMPEIVEDTPELAITEAMRLLFAVCPKVERLLRLDKGVLFKDGRLNIRISSQHYAMFKSSFARYVVRVKGVDRWVIPVDGVDRLVIDNSPKRCGGRGLELESVSRDHAGEDMERVYPFFEDLLTKDFYLPSEQKKAIDQITPILNTLVIEIRNHLTLVDTLGRVALDFNNAFKPLLWVYKKLGFL